MEPNTTIDTIGVLKDVGEVSEIISKTTSKPYQKRELTIVDNSMHSVRLTIWGPTAQNFDASPESIVAFKGVKVSDFGGRSLSLLSSGSMNVDPDIDEAHNLKGWYDANGRTDSYMSHQQANTGVSRSRKYKTIAQVNDEQIGMSDQPEYFNLKATVVYIKHDNFAYPACASQGCNKKVVEVNPDEWRCEKCNVTHSAPEYRYIMSCNVSDHTGQLWLSCFDESGRTIMGMPANELWAMKEDEENPGKAEQAFQNATCKTLIFNVKAKMDTFQDQQRYFPLMIPRCHFRRLTCTQSPLPGYQRIRAQLPEGVRDTHRNAQAVPTQRRQPVRQLADFASFDGIWRLFSFLAAFTNFFFWGKSYMAWRWEGTYTNALGMHKTRPRVWLGMAGIARLSMRLYREM